MQESAVVGIHGVPKGMDYLIDAGYNWILGCISIKTRMWMRYIHILQNRQISKLESKYTCLTQPSKDESFICYINSKGL